MAVFKVISVPQKYADEDAYADLIHYCIKPMKTPGNFIDGFGVLPQLAAEQMQIVSHAYRQNHGIRLRHWIISFEKGEIRDAWHANQFAQQACWFYAERYQILYSVHEDAQNIHIHFVMNMISFQDGTRYTGKKKDYYDFLRYLNDIAALFGTYVYPVPPKEIGAPDFSDAPVIMIWILYCCPAVFQCRCSALRSPFVGADRIPCPACAQKSRSRPSNSCRRNNAASQ